MALKFFKAKDLDSKSKVTIHKNGRLGFNSNAQRKMFISERMFIKIAPTDNFENDGSLYLVTITLEDEETFNISRAGDYYYANTKPLFDHLGIDYENLKVIYDIFDDEYEGERVFKLIKREIERKKEDDSEE